MGHQPLREDQAAALLLEVPEGPEEHVDRLAVVGDDPSTWPVLTPPPANPPTIGPKTWSTPGAAAAPGGQLVRPHLLGLHLLRARVRAGQPVGRSLAEQARRGHLGRGHVRRGERNGRLDLAATPRHVVHPGRQGREVHRLGGVERDVAWRRGHEAA